MRVIELRPSAIKREHKKSVEAPSPIMITEDMTDREREEARSHNLALERLARRAKLASAGELSALWDNDLR
jgi:hypothetical protein